MKKLSWGRTKAKKINKIYPCIVWRSDNRETVRKCLQRIDDVVVQETRHRLAGIKKLKERGAIARVVDADMGDRRGKRLHQHSHERLNVEAHHADLLEQHEFLGWTGCSMSETNAKLMLNVPIGRPCSSC